MGLFGFGGNGTLFWPGCFSSAFLPDKIENYEKILRKLKVRCSLTDKNVCCGGCLINAGYDVEARKLARENLEILKKNKISKIITSCPLCYKTFTQDYSEMLPDWDIEVEFILNAILDCMKKNPRALRRFVQENVVYHDSCYLGRYSEIYDEPRLLLGLIGCSTIEMENSKADSLCCGSCGNLAQTNPELADRIAKTFVKHISRTGTNEVVTADPQAYLHLKKNCAGTNINVIEFSDLLCDAFEIRRPKD